MPDNNGLERRIAKLEVDAAVDAEKNANLNRRLDKIEAGLSKLLWLVIALILGGVVNFVLNGGLVIGTTTP